MYCESGHDLNGKIKSKKKKKKQIYMMIKC